MNFSTPQRVLQTIRAGDSSEWTRGQNRVKINNAANCVPPLDVELAKQMGIKINVNWGELMVLLAQARRQYRRAYYGSLNFFNIGMPFAPPQYQQDWQLFVTDQINRKMRDSLKYFECFENMTAGVVCHGIGPTGWFDPYNWCPNYIAIEDLRIPTDTHLDFGNLEWYAIRKMYAPGELVKKAFAPDSRWDKKTVAQLLKNKKNVNWDFAANNYDWQTQPEKLAELVKQDGGYFMSDAMPTFPLWHFYFKDSDGWYLRIVPAYGTTDMNPNQFLWTSKVPVAKRRESLLQCQFGDLSNKAPFMYHSVRSLGYSLLEPTFYTNITRCRLLQHLHDNFNIWLRTNDPVDKARAAVQQFGNFGVLQPGLNIVPQSERHQIDPNLVEMGMAQLKQLMQESSATYTQSTDTGTSREQTAFETSVKVEQVNAMTSGLLIKSFLYETPKYREIVRRFFIPDSENEDAKEVQQNCKDYGIPPQFLDPKRWLVEAVTPLGMGNPVLARASAKELMEIRPLLSPQAQQEALHEIVLTFTNDPRKAARWVPLGRMGITDASRDAQAMFGTLMQGVPVPPRQELNPIDQIDAMLPLLAGKIMVLTQRDNMADREEWTGLTTVANYLQTLIQQLAQDPQEAQRVKQYGDSLGKLNNEIKALAQRGAEHAQQMQGQAQQDPVAEAKVQAIMMTTRAKLMAQQAKDKQKMQQASEAFIKGQRRDDAKAFGEIQRNNIIESKKPSPAGNGSEK